MISNIILLLMNDILLVLVKKAHDRYVQSDCKSNCCEGTGTCCLRYVEQRSSETTRVREKLDRGY